MSDQTKTFIAYIVSLSLLVLGLSLFKTWESSVLVRGANVETPQRASLR